MSEAAYSVGNRVYNGGSNAPTRGTVDPMGYIDREMNKPGSTGPSDSRSGLAAAALRRLQGIGGQPGAPGAPPMPGQNPGMPPSATTQPGMSPEMTALAQSMAPIMTMNPMGQIVLQQAPQPPMPDPMGMDPSMGGLPDSSIPQGIM